MRELERDLPDTATDSRPALPASLLIVGRGRVGGTIARAAERSGLNVSLAGRDPDVGGHDAVLLCVPDSQISTACEDMAGRLDAGTAVGHVSGATTLDALQAAAESSHPVFSLHPLQTVPDAEAELTGAPCAVAGDGPAGRALATALADALGMRPFEVPEESRAAYHAAASIASNLLIALEESATALLGRAGVDAPREALAPLVLRTAANWADAGPAALTGPIARGDEATVARHLEAIDTLAPELRPLYEALADRARAIGGAES